jgi:hypothetical protein
MGTINTQAIGDKVTIQVLGLKQETQLATPFGQTFNQTAIGKVLSVGEEAGEELMAGDVVAVDLDGAFPIVNDIVAVEYDAVLAIVSDQGSAEQRRDDLIAEFEKYLAEYGDAPEDFLLKKGHAAASRGYDRNTLLQSAALALLIVEALDRKQDADLEEQPEGE